MTHRESSATGAYDPERHHRRSIRLKGYDYSQSGAYFITIVAQDRRCLFGRIVNGVLDLNDAGRMLTDEWYALPERFPIVQLDEFIIMPNHMHAIIVIGPLADARVEPMPGAPIADAPVESMVGAPIADAPVESMVGAPLVGALQNGATTRVAPTVGNIVGAYKSWTTVQYARHVKNDGWPAFRGRFWQRNYYEHIIRDDGALQRIREYIATNPARWAEDPENPAIAQPSARPRSVHPVGAPLVGAPIVGAPLVGAPHADAPINVGVRIHVDGQTTSEHDDGDAES